MIKLTNRQARQFMLLKHGLLGDYKFIGEAGILEYVRQAGCIQFDPVDICGRNADLVLQARIRHYSKSMLDKLLYKDRLLVDYPDKNLAIILVEDWPYFERYRQASRQHAAKEPDMLALSEKMHHYIRENGEVCSGDLKLEGDIHWRSVIHWSGGKNLTRLVLEQMYSSGDLIIHHKNGTRKYYDLSVKHIPEKILDTPEPLPDEFEHQKWRVLRRIGAVGLLWNHPSDAWLNIWGLKAAARNEIFTQLLHEGEILEVRVDGIKDPLFCFSKDFPLIEGVLKDNEYKCRCEFIAPLDNFMWDRKLIKALFGFEYTWEIYTPPEKRKYSHYVLPVLFGEEFAARIEAVADRKTNTLLVKNIWYEDGVRQTKKLEKSIEQRLKQFLKFNECEKCIWF